MKYRISITKIERVKKMDRNWEKLYDAEAFKEAQVSDPDVDQYGYRAVEIEDDESKEMYSQTVEKEIDLKAIIDAFNK